MNNNIFIGKIGVSGTEYPYKNIKEILNIAKYLRVNNLELWIPQNFKYNELDELTKELDNTNLKVVCVSTWTQLNLEEDVSEKQKLIMKSIEAAKILNAGIVNTYFGPNPNSTTEESINRYLNNIERCLNKAINENIVIVLENEFDKSGTDITRRAKNVLKIVEKIDSPNFGINFDPCNFYFAGEEPFPYAYTLLKDYIKYIHLKDGMKYSHDLYAHPGDDFLWQDESGDYICTTLGKGAIPWEPLLKQLKIDNYTGFITLEPHVPVDILKNTFEDSLQYLNTLDEQ